MRIRVDRHLCSGHAQCSARAPELYTLDEEGYCSADGVLVPLHQIELAHLGARHCPEGAITLMEEDDPAPRT